MEGMLQAEIDDEVTMECNCDEGQEFRKQREQEEELAAAMINAREQIEELFHEDQPSIERIMKYCLDELVGTAIKKVTINTEGVTSGSVSIDGAKIRVNRIDKNTYTRETEL